MRLVDVNVRIGNILLDSNNPRFMTKPGDTQDEIKRKILNTQDAKTLLNSMKIEIRWVNKIVIRKHQNEGSYIAVEGNTRLACLKSGEISGYTGNTEIPVLVAEQEPGETNAQFEESIKITQGIANVMVVKQWAAVSKARHLYNMFWAKRLNNPGDTEVQTIRKIADSLGTTVKDVRDAVKRYSFFSEIAKESDTLEENQWSFLEAVDKNDITRKFFGFDDRIYKFEWEGQEEISDEMQAKKERLNNIPKIIRKEPINAQEFRDKFPKLVTDPTDEAKFYDLLEGSITWSSVGNNTVNNKDVWIAKLTSALQTLTSFPNQEDWATEEDVKEIMSKIKQRVARQLTIIGDSGD